MIHFYDENCVPDRVDIRRVVVAPHADDEVLGCGGLLAKHPKDTAVVVMARPDDVRIKEFEEAKAILDYHSAHIFNFADGYVGEDSRKTTNLLDGIVNAFHPQELYLPYPSMHQDHIASYEAGIRAARLSMGRAHWFTPNVYVYDVSAYDVNMYETSLAWNVFLSLTEEQIDKKVEAVMMYSSQVSEGPHPVNGLKEIASSIGAARYTRFAEKFALVREVRS